LGLIIVIINSIIKNIYNLKEKGLGIYNKLILFNIK
jgi:hypothetical protein